MVGTGFPETVYYFCLFHTAMPLSYTLHVVSDSFLHHIKNIFKNKEKKTNPLSVTCGQSDTHMWGKITCGGVCIQHITLRNQRQLPDKNTIQKNETVICVWMVTHIKIDLWTNIKQVPKLLSPTERFFFSLNPLIVKNAGRWLLNYIADNSKRILECNKSIPLK